MLRCPRESVSSQATRARWRRSSPSDAAGDHVLGRRGYYRLIGLEIATTWSLTSQAYWQLVCMGRHDDCSADVKTEASLPHHVIFDRVYVHGTPTGNARRGILANAAWVALVDSYISDIHEVGADTQAFGAWNGTGPYLIRNNYLEAGAENIMLGGADASIPNLVASDVTVIHNTFYKPDSWNQNHPSYGRIQWSIKNLFDEECAARTALRQRLRQLLGYQGDQSGYAIQLTPRNQSGGNPWSVVQDVTIKDNVFRNVGAGINLLASDYEFPSQLQARVQIWNNLMYNVRGQFVPGTGAAVQALSGPNDVSVRHNTTDTPVAILHMDGTNKTGLRLEWVDNLHNHGSYGFFGTNYGVGNPAIAQYLPNAPTITNNVMAAGDPSWYSNYPGNFFPANLAAVGFQDYDKHDFRLLPSSSFHNAATDGKDMASAWTSPSSTPPKRVRLRRGAELNPDRGRPCPRSCAPLASARRRRSDLGRVLDRLGGRAAMPALGDREHRARGLEDAAGDVRRLGAREPGDDRRDPARVHARLVLVAASAPCRDPRSCA